MLLQIRDVATLLDVTESRVYRWIEADELPAHQAYDHLGVNASELLEWATARRLSISPRIFDELHQRTARGSQLAEALERGGMATDIMARDHRAAIAAALRGLPWPKSFGLDGYIQLVLSRELDGTTTLGKGVAVPHPRFPTVLPGRKSAVRLCLLDHPLDFRATDGQLVDMLWLVLCPTQHDHLRLLAEMSVVLRNERFLQFVRQRPPLADIVKEVRRLEGEFLHPAGVAG